MDIGKKTIRRFGKRVHELRRSKGWSQEVLAFQLDQDRSYISSLERGLRNPTLKTIAYIAQALEVPISALFVD